MTLVPAVLRHLHWSFPQFFCILLSLRKLLFFFTVHPRLYFSDLKLRTLLCPFIFSFYLVLKDDRTFRFPFYPHDLRHGWSSSELTFIFLLFFSVCDVTWSVLSKRCRRGREFNMAKASTAARRTGESASVTPAHNRNGLKEKEQRKTYSFSPPTSPGIAALIIISKSDKCT